MSNVPRGMNFAIVGYSYSRGNILLDPSIPIEDLDSKLHTMVAAYVRSIALFGQAGKIDAIVPTWLENGVNVMFPIEVGTWNASILPWREQYGRELRGVGGTDKKVFAQDYGKIDAEIERLKPLVELGGYIPCPDHRIPPDAEWENVQYYCDRMREAFW